ncbi:MAG: hypothetical protein H8D97_00980 [Proteobacteria bacterium]|nr:hypothetical protein [Pseudomonadota bacterium]
MGESANIANEIFSKTTDHFKIDNEFKKSIFRNIFWRNREGLNVGAEKVLFDKDKWELNPQQFCLDYYNNIAYYKIVMIVNNIGSQFEFKRENFKDSKIIAPAVNDIYNVLAYAKFL